MSNRVTGILNDKFEKSEKVVLFGMNDFIHRALEDAKNVKKIAVKEIIDKNSNFWLISSWKLSLLNPNISFKQAYNEKKEIFERAGIASIETLSDHEKIIEIIKDLYELSGLIVFKKEEIIGFVSLVNFSESELGEIESFKKSSVSKEQIQLRARIKGGLAGADLSGFNLEGIDLRQADLRGADLSKANLSKANLRSANLIGANLSSANLTDAKLTRARLSGANLKDTTLINADLNHAELWHADMENAQLKGASLREAILYGANLKYANLEDADLFNAGLMSANLEGTDLSNADIRNANLKYAIFDKKTNLRDVKVNSITIDNLTNPEIKGMICKE